MHAEVRGERPLVRRRRGRGPCVLERVRVREEVVAARAREAVERRERAAQDARERRGHGGDARPEGVVLGEGVEEAVELQNVSGVGR